MPGHRERKRRKTMVAIHDAAMRLFAERGYAAVTAQDIAEAAEVSRATVFVYYRTKEEIVLGDSEGAIDQLRAALAEAEPATVVDHVRAWAGTLSGWIEPDIVLQRRLAEEVPGVGAARSRVVREIETVIGEALARTLDTPDPLAPRLVAAALTAALVAVEAEAADRVEHGNEPLSPAVIDTLFDSVAKFVDGGLTALETPAPGSG